MLRGVSRLAHTELRRGPGVRECSIRVSSLILTQDSPGPAGTEAGGKVRLLSWLMHSGSHFYGMKNLVWNPSVFTKLLHPFGNRLWDVSQFQNVLRDNSWTWSLDYKFHFFCFLLIRVGYLLIFCLILGIAKIFWTFKTLRASVFKTLEDPLDSFLGCPGVIWLFNPQSLSGLKLTSLSSGHWADPSDSLSGSTWNSSRPPGQSSPRRPWKEVCAELQG